MRTAQEIKQAMTNGIDAAVRKAPDSKPSAAQLAALSVVGALGVVAEELASLHRRLDEIEARGVKYAGTYQRAQTYRRGDVVTHKGSAWAAVAAETESEPGNTASWQLMVRGVDR